LRRLLAVAAKLPTQAADPAPYWQRRRDVAVPVVADRQARAEQLQTDWGNIVNDLPQRGYLDRIAPRRCVDAAGPGD